MTTTKTDEMTRREAATIEYKQRVNAAWMAANPRRRTPHFPFPEVAECVLNASHSDDLTHAAMLPHSNGK